MSVNSVSPQCAAPDAIAALARQIWADVDANRDGQLSASEFEGFLKRLLDGLSTPRPTDPRAPGALRDPETGTTDEATLIDPSDWTDNNAPYGVTFAGFSTQDHTNLSVADLANPINAKYLAYDYLLTHQLQANQSWAPAVADALNQIVGSKLFQATDGETLAFGDEFIHSAPNGHGMLAGTYNPAAVGEFFWGVA